MRWIIMLAAAALVLPPGGSFVDDDGNVHEGYIEAIAEANITRGCNPPANTRYCPEAPVSRAQMATFLVRTLDLPPAPNLFADGSGAGPHIDDVGALAAAGVTRGCNPPDNDRYCPEAPVTRAQMATFLVRSLDLPPGTGGRFSDVSEDNPHIDDIASLASAGITRGCNPPANTRYCPDQPVRRDEMASFLGRALGLTPNAPPPPTTTTTTTTTVPPSVTTTTTVDTGGRIVTAGAFCARQDAGLYARTTTGKLVRCTSTATDSRLRWRAV